MKGMSQTLYIVVAAIVILVAALVIITIFAGGVSKFSTLADATSYCNNIAIPLCSLSGDDAAIKIQLRNVNVEIDGNPSNCEVATSGCGCEPANKKWNCGG